MTKTAVVYARVSTEGQNREGTVSIEQQLQACRALCERGGWEIAGEFVDAQNYTATQNPKRGKTVNPSGERADRPALLKVLELVRAGELDMVVAWREDRLVRHPRVYVALEDALDAGDARRGRRDKTLVLDATGAVVDRFVLGIKAQMGREENRRRSERVRMGKIGTLQAGGWPGVYKRYGYELVRIEGKRGKRIVPADDEEVENLRRIFEWCAAGLSLQDIRDRLIALGVEQKKGPSKHEWGTATIHGMLRSDDYLGHTTWTWADGESHTIEIPQIIEPELWQRAQEQLDRNKTLALRNAKGVYLLQGILYCGECGRLMSAMRRRYEYRKGDDGETQRVVRAHPLFWYFCSTPRSYPEEEHASPYCRSGEALDWTVWRHLVDYGIKQPDTIQSQIRARQAELQAQDQTLDSEIARARAEIADVENARAAFQRQQAYGKISWDEFERRIAETEEARRYWTGEVEHLRTLRDDAQRVEAGLEYVERFMRTVQADLDGIDQEPDALKALPKDEQHAILEKRRRIIRALVDRVTLWANGRIEIEGVLDGSEAAQFEYASLRSKRCSMSRTAGASTSGCRASIASSSLTWIRTLASATT